MFKIPDIGRYMVRLETTADTERNMKREADKLSRFIV